MNPLVTCLCLTRNRREWLPKAIECFRRQTYEMRQLLIVADQRSDVDGIPLPEHAFVLFTEGTVGRKRNQGCALSVGDLIAIWDDDDYSAPGRLEQQVAELGRTGKALTGYREMKFTDGERWWQYRGGRDFALATSMCFRRDLWATRRFQEINCGQDEAFCAQASAKGELAACPDMDLMYATIHPGNTSPRRVEREKCYAELPGFAWQEKAAA